MHGYSGGFLTTKNQILQIGASGHVKNPNELTTRFELAAGRSSPENVQLTACLLAETMSSPKVESVRYWLGIPSQRYSAGKGVSSAI